MSIFTVRERDRVCERVLELATSDIRITAGAIVGSLAHDAADRWADLDLTFGVGDSLPLCEVLEDWTRTISAEFNAVHLFDVPSGPAIYRVFLLPGCLQFDLFFTPSSHFGALGPQFKLLFGESRKSPSRKTQPLRNSLVMGCTTRCGRVFVSNVAVIGRRSIGSAARVTMR